MRKNKSTKSTLVCLCIQRQRPQISIPDDLEDGSSDRFHHSASNNCNTLREFHRTVDETFVKIDRDYNGWALTAMVHTNSLHKRRWTQQTQSIIVVEMIVSRSCDWNLLMNTRVWKKKKNNRPCGLRLKSDLIYFTSEYVTLTNIAQYQSSSRIWNFANLETMNHYV